MRNYVLSKCSNRYQIESRKKNGVASFNKELNTMTIAEAGLNKKQWKEPFLLNIIIVSKVII